MTATNDWVSRDRACCQRKLLKGKLRTEKKLREKLATVISCMSGCLPGVGEVKQYRKF